MFDISCSIVTYKTDRNELRRVIKCFFNSKLNSILYISDNSPCDELRNVISEFKNENILYILNNENGGYGYGHNKIIQKIKGESKYHLILNPDIYFEENTLEQLYNYMNENEDVGNVMPMVKYPNGDIQYLCKKNPSPFNIFFRRFCICKKLKERLDYKYQMRDMEYNKIVDAPILSGCFMFIRTKIFEEIGMFDERYFMYFEDFDLNRRIHQKYKTIFYPYAEIVHAHAREAHKNLKMTIVGMKSAIIYFNKWGWFFDGDKK